MYRVDSRSFGKGFTDGISINIIFLDQIPDYHDKPVEDWGCMDMFDTKSVHSRGITTHYYFLIMIDSFILSISFAALNGDVWSFLTHNLCIQEELQLITTF